MPLSPALAVWLRDQGYDAIHAAELGLNRAPDIEIIARAKQDGRTIITIDLDYPRLLALARTTEPSLILFRDGDWSEADVIVRMRAEHYRGGSGSRAPKEITDWEVGRRLVSAAKGVWVRSMRPNRA
jgi:predicted nuclease of predicted toxin-antitoxin system